ncbi:MAG: hypothetical protein ABL899_00565 [Nitrospira sp.]
MIEIGHFNQRASNGVSAFVLCCSILIIFLLYGMQKTVNASLEYTADIRDAQKLY